MHLDKRFSVFCPKKLKEILGFSKSRRERPIKTMFEDPTVAPRAGAWIETKSPNQRLQTAQVAPRAGAWIETLIWPATDRTIMSLPCGRAWIETSYGGVYGSCLIVALVRERGLKQILTSCTYTKRQSLSCGSRGLKPIERAWKIILGSRSPVRERGLKREKRISQEGGHCRSRAGAWIETDEHKQKDVHVGGRLVRERGLKQSY